jgi:hypothetical protein
MFAIPDQALVVRTISFKLLDGLAVVGHLRRKLTRVSVTTNPTAEWLAGQVTEALPWKAPRPLTRDRDRSFSPAYTHGVGFGAADLRRVLKVYASYYNRVRTHLSLSKDAPLFRRSQTVGDIAAIPVPGGLPIVYMFAYGVFGKDSIRSLTTS